MSMYRQLWLSILASMLIALGASLLASLLNARSYLEAQLAMKNQDNAATLALALSQGRSDRDSVVLAVTALFNGGHYELIQVIDPNGKALVDKVNRQADAGAPVWFVRLLPIRSLPGRAEIASGWQPLGTLTLMSRSHFAYRSLWETALTMSGVILAAGLLGGLLASLVLRRITRPLRAVVEQAKAINDRRFICMPVPDVPEIKELAAAMNDTVSRLRVDFEVDARRYEDLRRKANHDALSGLANRALFLNSLDAALDDEDSPYGVLAIIRLRYLGKLNRRQGREVADEVVRCVGHAVGEVTSGRTGIFAGRLNGADFALLLPADGDPLPTLRELLVDLPKLAEPLASGYSTTYIGYSAFTPGDDPARLMARIDTALAAADVEGRSAIREAPAEVRSEAPAGGEAWREVLRHALADHSNLKLAQFPLRLGDSMQMECALRLRVGEAGEWLPAGRFLPMADRLGMMPELDLASVDLALHQLAVNARLEGVWINLSAKSISDTEFRRQLLHRLYEHFESCERLWLEIPEAGGLLRVNALRELSRELKPLGCRLGLEHYGHQFSRIGELYELGLDFLKVDASFIHDIDTNPGNQAFLTGLCEIAHRIGLRVCAEGVERQEEWSCLRDLGFDGASGLAVR